jgi:uncharacterized protein YndB with AHSA1/START domain
MSNSDRIEKRVTLKAPRTRVWKALVDSAEFGKWFGAKLDGPFVPGATTRGRITTPNYDHLTIEFFVERIEPESYFSYRWHPHAVDAAADYSREATTLVEFRLDQDGSSTVLTIIESGFDGVPLARRAEAFRMNNEGWDIEARNIENHVTAA